MKTLLLFLALFCISVSATDRTTLHVIITNTPVNGDNLVVNSSTRTWKPTATNISSQITIGASIGANATNLFNHTSLTPFGSANLTIHGTNGISIQGQPGVSMSYTLSGTWGYVTTSVQTGSSGLAVVVPMSNMSSTGRVFAANAIVDGLNDYADTSTFDTAAPALVNFVNTTETQTLSNKTLTGGTFTTGTLTDTTLGYVKIPYSTTAETGIEFFSSGASRITTIAADANGIPTLYGTALYPVPTNDFGAYSPSGGNLLTRNAGDTYYGRLALANSWTGTNTFTRITNSTIVNSTLTDSTYSGTVGLLSSGYLSGVASTNMLLTNATAKINLTIAGDIAYSRYDHTTLASGNNANVNFGTNVFVEITSGPTAAFAINGIANGRDGKFYWLYNKSGYQMTIANESGTDPVPANRIKTASGTDTIIGGSYWVPLIYDSGQSRWVLINQPIYAPDLPSGINATNLSSGLVSNADFDALAGIAASGLVTTLANPTGTIGLVAVNGTSTNAMRADAAPALSQAISPTWTGAHVFRRTTTPVEIQYSAGVGATFTPTSGGDLTIVPSGGDVNVTGNITASSDLYASGSDLFLSSASGVKFSSIGDGILALYNTAGSGFTRILFGGTAVTDVGLKPDGSGVLSAILGNNSGYATLKASEHYATDTLRVGTGTPTLSVSSGNMDLVGEMTISAGNLGIATLSPTNKLHIVNGNGQIGTGGVLYFGDATDHPTTDPTSLPGAIFASKGFYMVFGAENYSMWEVDTSGTLILGDYRGDRILSRAAESHNWALGGAYDHAMWLNTVGLGVGTTNPATRVEINSPSGTNLRLTYNDADGSAANYADLLTTSGGDLTIVPSGGDVTITGTLATSGDFSINGNDLITASGNLNLTPASGIVNVNSFLKIPRQASDATASANAVFYVKTNGDATGGEDPLFGRSDGFRLQNSDGTVDYITARRGGNVGIGTSSADKALEINSATGATLRQTYDDSNGSAANYVDTSVTSGGDYVIAPSGGDTSVTGTLAVSGALSSTTATLSGLTPGSVAFAGTGGLISQDNANFFWDDTNNRLGIGTASPSRALTISTTGAGIQSLFSVENLQTAAADVGAGFVFNGMGSAAIGRIAAGLDGASTANSYLVFSTFASSAIVEAMRLRSDGKVLIGTPTSNGGKLEVLSTTEQLRLDYDATHYATHAVNSSGNLTIAPSGGTVSVTGILNSSGYVGSSGAGFLGRYFQASTSGTGGGEYRTEGNYIDGFRLASAMRVGWYSGTDIYGGGVIFDTGMYRSSAGTVGFANSTGTPGTGSTLHSNVVANGTITSASSVQGVSFKNGNGDIFFDGTSFYTRINAGKYTAGQNGAFQFSNNNDGAGGSVVAGINLASSANLTLTDGTTANMGSLSLSNLTAYGTMTGNGSGLTALNATQLTSGTVPAARMPALTGDVTSSAGSVATTLATTQAGAHNWTALNTFTVGSTNQVKLGYDITQITWLSTDSGGEFNIFPTTPEVNVAGYVDAQLGFKVNNAAGSGLYLRGDGTKGVFAALAGADLTGTIASGVQDNITRVGTLAAGAVPTTLLTGTLQAAQFPALTGDVTTSAGSLATTINESGIDGTIVPGVEFVKTVTGINAATAGTTTLLTVQSGKRFVMTGLTIETTALTVGPGNVPTFEVGIGASHSAIMNTTTYDESAAVDTYQTWPGQGTAGGPKSNASIATSTQEVNITFANGGTFYTTHTVAVSVRGFYR